MTQPPHLIAVTVAMTALGVSGRELARRCGWSQSYAARRLNGRVELSPGDLDAIAKALGVDL